MNHRDHIDLLRAGVASPTGAWADLGCGNGAFTLALADLLDASSVIHAVDIDRGALSDLRRRARTRFRDRDIRTIHADFTQPLDLPPLDGIVMANSLHFHRDKEPIVRSASELLKPHGAFLLIEYDVDRGNRWVPFPISYERWLDLSRRCGFALTVKIGAKPSSFLGEIYSSVAR
jgi:SAM-dependent methyltransferase